MAYYTGCFAQLKEPDKLYNEIIDNLDSRPQSGQDMFNFLKLRASMMNNTVDQHFNIPLKLIPEFRPDIFSYIYNLKEDNLKIYIPDVVLSVNNVILKPVNGNYIITSELLTQQSSIMKIKYNNQIYTVMIIKSKE